MSYFARFSPVRAITDLRRFLSYRQAHELWFGILAIFLTAIILLGFVHDSRGQPQVPKQKIIYVQQWPLSRTDKQIIAQQKIDQVQRDKEAAELRARQEKVRQQFKRMDDQLKSYGL